MKLLRMRDYVVGFLWHEPLEELPVVTHGGEAMSNPGFKVVPHFHTAFEFLYLSRGSIDWRVGDEVASQQMGDLIVMFPGEVHAMERPVESESHRIWIGVDLENCGASGRRLANHLRKKKIRVLPRCQIAESIMQAIIRQAVSNLPMRREAIFNFLRSLITVVEQRYQAMQRESSLVEKTQLPYTHGILKAVSHMERYLNRHIPLAELASIAVVGHVSQFCAQFKREVGIPPAAYHLQLRLHAAQTDLLQLDMSITLVALQYGFNSSQHFSTAFRRAFGMTPREWQLQHAGRKSSVQLSRPVMS